MRCYLMYEPVHKLIIYSNKSQTSGIRLNKTHYD